MSWKTNFDTLVPIRNEFLKELPFSLKTRLGIAIVLSFLGNTLQVADFMQKANNKTRAYYFNL